jgi:hypothetical protein
LINHLPTQESIHMQPITAECPVISSPAGAYTVQLSRVRPDVFRVEVLSSGAVAFTVDELTRSYDSEPLARSIARVITVALRAEDATVESARAAVCAFLDAQMEFLTIDDSTAVVAAIAKLQTLKAFFESEDLKAWSANLIDRINATLDKVRGGAR